MSPQIATIIGLVIMVFQPLELLPRPWILKGPLLVALPTMTRL